MKRQAQLSLELPTWGGKRDGAGRKPNGDEAGVSHLARPRLSGREPVHVTLRVIAGVGNLRAQRQAAAIQNALRAGKLRFGLHLTHYSIQGNHIHFIVDPVGNEALSRGMQGLAVRIAQALNRLAARRGRVFADRFHAHVLHSRREVANAVRYVLHNFRKHSRRVLPAEFIDPCSSEAWRDVGEERRPCAEPRSWLLRGAG